MLSRAGVGAVLQCRDASAVPSRRRRHVEPSRHRVGQSPHPAPSGEPAAPRLPAAAGVSSSARPVRSRLTFRRAGRQTASISFDGCEAEEMRAVPAILYLRR